jgi:hypothetical protein
MNPKERIYFEAVEADSEWQAELVRMFHSRAGDIRYTETGKGKPGSRLRQLHDNFMQKSEALRRSFRSSRLGEVQN